MRKLSLLLFLVACGDDGVRHTPDATTHDAPSIDGAPDASPDAAAGAVTITVTKTGSAAAGVTVYFQNADNSVVLATTTDANGAASAVMSAGGSVTVVEPFLAVGRNPPDELNTFVGVKPGDHLHLDGATFGSFTVTYNGPTSQNANTASYSVFSPCLVNGTTNGINLGSAASTSLNLSRCGTTTDFVEVAYDASGNPLEYMRATGVAVSASGTVDLTAQTFTAVTAKTYSYTNVPAAYGQPTITQSLATITGNLDYAEAFSGSTTASTSRGIPAFTGAIDVTSTSMFNGLAGIQNFIDWGTVSASYTLDVGSRALPDLNGAASYAAATHQVTVSEAAGGVAPDFTRLSIDANRTSDARYWTWTVVSPHATAITLPTLPTTTYDYNIGATDTVTSIDVVIGKVPGGYDAVRAHLASFDSFLQFIASLSGSMTIEGRALAFSGKSRVLAHRTR